MVLAQNLMQICLMARKQQISRHQRIHIRYPLLVRLMQNIIILLSILCAVATKIGLAILVRPIEE
ncbi:hypothetical protein TQ39_07585 [Ruthenibacterium lactatiformans]|uniref:Uncharacterized protein n=1 Tax=Ruthenibacterium lactatiformans TaxID=1550024 RepID=A0A0D8J029_9FIRM|nr:hypothetical protein TQ39_07585 [Ruthenibacterium lactatiformans]